MRGWQTYGRVHDKRRKKTRPQRREAPEVRQRVANAEAATTAGTAEPVRTARPAATWRNTPTPRPSSFATIRPEDYHYVYGDLKRIAVLATAIFAILVILSFVIR